MNQNLHELTVDMRYIRKIKIANGNKKELVKAMFNDIVSTSHLYKTRKSLKISEIQIYDHELLCFPMIRGTRKI